MELGGAAYCMTAAASPAPLLQRQNPGYTHINRQKHTRPHAFMSPLKGGTIQFLSKPNQGVFSVAGETQSGRFGLWAEVTTRKHRS